MPDSNTSDKYKLRSYPKIRPIKRLHKGHIFGEIAALT